MTVESIVKPTVVYVVVKKAKNNKAFNIQPVTGSFSAP